MIRLPEEIISELWSHKPSEPQAWTESREELKKHVKDSPTSIAAWLNGETALEVQTHHVRELEDSLGQRVGLRYALRNLTEQLRLIIPDFPLARIPIEVRRTANPINPDIYTPLQIKKSRHLLDVLTNGYKRDLSTLSMDAQLGLLLLNAAYSGGLLDQPQLKELMKVETSKVIWVCGLPEIRLSLSIRGQADAESRQWFPDPMSLALIVRISGAAKERNHQPFHYVKALLREVSNDKHLWPDSIGDFLTLLRMQIQLRLPQLLVNHACRAEYLSHSIKPSSWFGMWGLPAPDDPVTHEELTTEQESSYEIQVQPWLSSLCKKIRQNETLKSDEDPRTFSGLVTSFASYMQSGNSRSQNGGLAKETISRYTRLLGMALEPLLDEMDLFSLEKDTLEDIYEIALESVESANARAKLARAIHEFHDYLVKTYHYPAIGTGTLFGVGGAAQVDAQLITEEQYQQALQTLQGSELSRRHPRLVTAAQLMLIFGFRLGLRRSEALKLRMEDVHLPLLPLSEQARIQARHPNMKRLTDTSIKALDLTAELLIRPHALRGLKSISSQRKSPLNTLFSANEMQLVEEWFAQRETEEDLSKTSEFFFCIPALRTRWISEDYLFPVIHECLRAATGNKTLRFHHLRHSCATWLLLKLFLAKSGRSAGILFSQRLPKTLAWLQDNERLLKNFFGGVEGPTRKLVHIVTGILGHSSPRMTLHHYVHSLPWLQALFWQWNSDHWAFSTHNVATVAQVSQPTKVDGDDLQSMLTVIGRIKPLKNSKRSSANLVKEVMGELEFDWVMTRLKSIEALLAYQSFADICEKSVNLEWSEFDAGERGSMLDRAAYIRDLAGASGEPKHRMESLTYSQARSMLPSLPKHGGRDAIKHYAERLYELLDGPEQNRVIRILDDFVERCWLGDTTLRFYQKQDEEHACDHFWLLQALGINRSSIELIIYDGAKPEATKKYWRKQLGSIRQKLIYHKAENAEARNTHLGIRATLHLEDGTENHHSGSALRYLFLMASIDWHFR